MKINLSYICILACLISCSKASEAHLIKESEASMTLTTKQAIMVQENNAFAFLLMNHLSEYQKESFLFSPTSATYALGIAAQGASGPTRQEITTVLGFGDNQNELNHFCLNLIYRCLKADPEVQIKNANLVVANDIIDIKQEFSTTIADYYDAQTISMNKSNAQSKINYINNWVSDHTDGMVPKVLSETEGLLTIITAVSFNARWSNPFSSSEIIERPFYKTSSESFMTRMLARQEGLRYEENATASMVQLPYGQGKYTLSLILPKKGILIDDFLKSFDREGWDSLTKKTLRVERVNLAFPIFKTETEINLKGPLEKMGIHSAFYDADFSEMTQSDIYISKVLQNSTITVDEEGTRATSSTNVEFVLSSPGPNEGVVYDFIADRPFLYVISDTATDTILFVGCYRG